MNSEIIYNKIKDLVEANATKNSKAKLTQGKLLLKCCQQSYAIKYPKVEDFNDIWWNGFQDALKKLISNKEMHPAYFEIVPSGTKLTLAMTGLIKCQPLDQDLVYRKFAEAQKKLICLDYDGTLRKFEATPPEAYPSECMKKMLSQLASKSNTTVAIISGRDSRDLEGWFKDPNLYLIGDHGTRIRNKSGKWESLISYQIKDRENLFQNFEQFFKSYDKGWVFEKKETSFGVNCRGISPNTQQKLTELCAAFEQKFKTELDNNQLKIQQGVSDIEILNRGSVNKGEGIRKMLSMDQFDFVLVAGDAWTDEDMFKAAPNNSCTIKLGSPIDPKDQSKQTFANYYIDVEESDVDNDKKVQKFVSLIRKLASNPFDAAIFDLDGVLTQTATTHSSAWGQMFNEYLEQREKKDGQTYPKFENQKDYLPYVDGKARYDGVKSFLASRGITDLPFGDPSDTPDKETVCGLGNRKNILFNEKVEQDGVEFYQSTIEFIKDLKKRGIKVACASSSKNCIQILKKLKLLDLFESIVDGQRAADLKLRSKPEGDIFCQAAKEINVEYHRTVVVEDATSGVAAGKKGGFGLVLGIARHKNQVELELNGGDIIVEDMSEITYDDIVRWFEVDKQKTSWNIIYNKYDPVQEGVREALCVVGNGYQASRHGCEENNTDKIHNPGLYLASLFNTLPSQVGDRTLYNEDFVCCPNWALVNWRCDGGDWFNIDTAKIVKYERWINMFEGTAHREVLVEDQKGRRTQINSKRLISMQNPHEGVLSYSVIPQNYSGKIELKWGINGDIINEGVARYSSLNQKHLDQINAKIENNLHTVTVQTNQSKITISESCKVTLSLGNNNVTVKSQNQTTKGSTSSSQEFEVKEKQELKLEKAVAIYKSSDKGVKNPEESAKNHAQQMSGNYNDVYLQSCIEWKKLWDKADIIIEGDRLVQRLIRLHIFHMIVSGSPFCKDYDYSIGARGLHGEAYRGHVFWDEIYIFPFYTIHWKEVTRSFLMYRYRRLEEAKKNSIQDENCKGAMYPWQSGSTGKEETQILHLNPKNGEWDPDLSRRQRHVNLAIQYNIWQYYHMTLDKDFLNDYGAEVFFEICRFWASKANEKNGKWHIEGVMGPDEYHEKYPEADLHHGGFRDNTYTNLMVVWAFETAKWIWQLIEEPKKKALKQKINIDDKEFEQWLAIAKNMNICINDDEILEQFDGFFKLKELDWEGYKKKYGGANAIARLDRIMKAEGQSPDDYQLAKQADTLMIFYNLKTETIINKLGHLGIKIKDKENFLRKQFEYYYPRTSHGSTLSRVVHAALTNEMGIKDDSWNLYIDALTSDYIDIQGGTTKEGIHAGVMAGTILMALKYYLGLNLESEYVSVIPKLPDHWRRGKFNFEFRKCHYEVELDTKNVEIVVNDEHFVYYQKVQM